MPFHPACRAHKRKHPVLVWHQWIGPYQNSFDPAKYRGVSADPQRQAKNSQNGEAGTAPKHPEAEAQVLEKRSHYRFVRPQRLAIVLVFIRNEALPPGSVAWQSAPENNKRIIRPAQEEERSR